MSNQRILVRILKTHWCCDPGRCRLQLVVRGDATAALVGTERIGIDVIAEQRYQTVDTIAGALVLIASRLFVLSRRLLLLLR